MTEPDMKKALQPASELASAMLNLAEKSQRLVGDETTPEILALRAAGVSLKKAAENLQEGIAQFSSAAFKAEAAFKDFTDLYTTARATR